ncbi:MAG TPA: GNAT family N-acetyltransferase [Methylomirabilota bacterium]|nr:GNAT family N-acetyltransferase [Methylomirabilota bacterium]
MRAPEIPIRPCRREEAAAVLDLWRHAQAFPSATDTIEQLQRLCREPGAAFLVATDGGRVVGSVIGGWDGWRGNIYRLAVAPEHRRRGLALALVEAVERWLVERGARRIAAIVEGRNALGIGFWDSLNRLGYENERGVLRYVKTLSR